MLNSWSKSHIGQRKVNEDKYLIDDELDLYIVADGVGGMDKGEVASTIACDAVSNSIRSGMTLKESVYIAHRAIIKEIKNNEKTQGMATTIVAALFNENSYEIAWVGDSRAYIWDKGLKLLTRDGAYVELLLENGHIGIDELETHPDRNVISQALGIERKSININYNKGTLENDQILLLCTDGLYSIANELNIINSIKQTKDIKDITDALVNIAVEKDGKDNITLISIISHSDSKDESQIIKPKVFREYDIVTGKVVGYEQAEVELHDQNPGRTHKVINVEEDPELIDQTELKDLTQDDINLLDTAANNFISINEENTKNNSLFPVILITTLVLVGVLLYFIMK